VRARVGSAASQGPREVKGREGNKRSGRLTFLDPELRTAGAAVETSWLGDAHCRYAVGEGRLGASCGTDGRREERDQIRREGRLIPMDLNDV
jgi:hypothetical protein